MTDPLVFIASIAPLQTAISIASDGGARVKVDIPESELEAIRALLGMRGKRLIMTVQVADEFQGNSGNERKATRPTTDTRTARSPTDVAGG